MGGVSNCISATMCTGQYPPKVFLKIAAELKGMVKSTPLERDFRYAFTIGIYADRSSLTKAATYLTHEICDIGLQRRQRVGLVGDQPLRQTDGMVRLSVGEFVTG